jgi:hypothetical protein
VHQCSLDVVPAVFLESIALGGSGECKADEQLVFSGSHGVVGRAQEASVPAPVQENSAGWRKFRTFAAPDR